MPSRLEEWWAERHRIKRLSNYYSMKSKTADRPHRLTVILALGSPLLAILATAISLISLRTSQSSLEIGQRAYLTIEESKLEILFSPEPYYDENGLQEHKPVAHIEISFVAKNLGNTPAKISEIVSNYDRSGWGTFNLRGVEREVAPKGGITMKFGGLVRLTDDASSEMVPHGQGGYAPAYDDPEQLKIVHDLGLILMLTFKDVFGNSHEITWTTYGDRQDKWGVHKRRVPSKVK